MGKEPVKDAPAAVLCLPRMGGLNPDLKLVVLARVLAAVLFLCTDISYLLGDKRNVPQYFVFLVLLVVLPHFRSVMWGLLVE